MFYDPVRKALVECRTAILKSLLVRTCAEDIHALAVVDGLLLADGSATVQDNARKSVGLTFHDAPANDAPGSEVETDEAGYAALAAELEALKLARLQDSKIIEGLQARLKERK